jgi:hypothetical protein
MYHKRRRAVRRRRAATALGTFATFLTVVACVPALASANPVNDLLNKLGVGNGGGAAEPAPTTAPEPKAGVPPTYVPPLHGTDPHGQGTVAGLDLEPSNTNPYPSEPATSDGEELVIGDSRGEQGSSGYDGRVTLLYLMGNPIIQVTSNPGESNDGPLQPLQDGLDAICDGSGGQLCGTLLGMHSSTTSNSSTNSFTAANLQLGGEGGVGIDAASSNGNISDDGTCQTTHGDSSLADVGVAGFSLLDLMQGSSTSTACNNGSQSVENDSTAIALGGNDVPVPDDNCANGTPNSSFTDLLPLLGLVCNADDTNGDQTSTPYGVREALGLFLLVTDDVPAIKATLAGPESHAVAPPVTPTTPTTPGTPGTPGGGTQGGTGSGGNGNGNAGDNGSGGGNGPAAGTAAAGNGELAFTGSDLLVLGLIGASLIFAGIALVSAAAERERETA